MSTKLNSSTTDSSCKFTFADGRHCRMSLTSYHRSLCPFHARAEEQLLESHPLGSEIATSLTGDFLTATDLNHMLGKVFTALAQDRIPLRTAATLAYLGQVMHQAIPNVNNETRCVYRFETWQNLIKEADPLSEPGSLLPRPAAPAPTPISGNGKPASDESNSDATLHESSSLSKA
jgi:hypothetical protein